MNGLVPTYVELSNQAVAWTAVGIVMLILLVAFFFCERVLGPYFDRRDREYLEGRQQELLNAVVVGRFGHQ